ncbi:mannose-1-phosphate guanylyltransferase/mannose-6-phosphate isomerase [Rhodobacteraceae bacterium CCMM004]|nr:mannose-1-phosphate guanylyltransferase/mannose-6-phosphate isomerase [Rhodobacteraceae bacterium CCMM004]
MMIPDSVCPVVLCGGSGTRLWPLSRPKRPKQFVHVTADRTLLEMTLDRTRAMCGRAPVFITNDDYRFIVREQAQPRYGDDVDILLEPMKRDTAPAVLLAALHAARADGVETLLIMPSDHIIEPVEALAAAVRDGLASLDDDTVCVFGLRPDRPATTYGYIRAAEEGRVSEVAEFVEKPDAATARTYLESGDYLWNSGIFLARVDALLRAYKTYAPEVFAATRAAYEAAESDLGFLRVPADAYARNPSISIDYALMEKIPRRLVVRGDFRWNDAGNWREVRDLNLTDAADDNAAVGRSELFECRRTMSYSTDKLTVCVGLDDVTVVNTDDACLVISNAHLDKLKSVLETLGDRGLAEIDSGTTDYRPWGSFTSLDIGPRHQVKMIRVKPGERLSLQRHHHRAEHWIVVQGTALVEVDGEERLVTENQTIYIPLGADHRLTNPGKIPLSMIEVQTGSYLGEDDIIRLDDIYKRSEDEH